MPIFQVVDKLNDEVIKKLAKLEEVQTDSVVFRLFYKLSIWLVGIYSIAHVYISMESRPITCLGPKPKSGKSEFLDKVEDYCWVHGTYVIRKSSYPYNQIYPGVSGFSGPEDSVVYHHYYRWMYFIILIMIIALYTPRYLWRSIENGKMKELAKKLSRVSIIDDVVKKEAEGVGEYLYCYLGYHRKYASGLILCEILNVAVAAILLYVWDSLTNHELSRNASSALSFITSPRPNRNDPLIEIFPVIGKCTFKDYGPSGNIQIYDFICVLPINVVNEKAFVFFWFYFIALIAVGSAHLVFRLMLVVSKHLRFSLLSKLLPSTSAQDVHFVINKCTYSDWYVLYQIGINVEPLVYRHVWQKLLSELRIKENNINI